jgi:hypothetical protein
MISVLYGIPHFTSYVIYIYMNIMQHIKSISMLYIYNLYHSIPFNPRPPMVPSAVPSTQLRCEWQDRFVGRSILAVAGVLHSPETSDDLLIELDDGKVLAGKPQQFDGKNPWVSG